MTNTSSFIKNMRLLAVLLTTLLLWSAPTTGNIAHAQTNPYKINDRIYDYWKTRINPVIQKKEVLERIDTMFMMGQKLNDLKAQCIAKSLRCRHYYHVQNIPLLKENLKRCQDFCVKTPYKQYYFDAWNLLIIYYASNDTNEAIEECQKYQKAAYALNNPYGIIFSHSRLSDLYTILSLHKQAEAELNIAIEQAKRLNYEKELPSLYRSLAHTFINEKKYKEASQYLQMAYLNINNIEKDVINTLECYLLLSYCKQKEHPDSIAYLFDAISKKRQRKAYHYSKLNEYTYYQSICAYYEYKNEPQKVFYYADSTGNSSLAWKLVGYRLIGDAENTALCYDRLIDLLQNRMENQNKSYINKLAMTNNILQLEQDKNALALKNTQMQLLHASDQVRISNAQIEQNKLELKNSALELKTQQAETEKTRAILAKEHEELLREADQSKLIRQENHIQLMQIVMLAILFLCSVIIFVIYYYRRNLERKRLLHEKQIAEEACIRAENADRLKSMFLQNMSHEIRTPLNAIVGFTELLNNNDMPLEDAERQEFKSLVRTNADLLTGLINDILDLSKLETNNYKLNLSPVPVADVCKDALNSVSHRAQEGVKLILDLPKSAEERKLELQTDRLRLNQVLINFLTNACKYTEKGSITLAYRLNGDYAVFSVTDTGTGIPKEKAEEVFNRFEKLDEFKQGTGLGLNICQHITQLVHGKIYVDTSYTQGARFVFEHPLHIEQ